MLASLSHAYGLSGNRNEARKIIAALQAASKHHYVANFDIAVAFAGIGDRDNTFQWLEKAYANRESQMAFINVTRRLDSVRTDPRFADLLQKLKLNGARPVSYTHLYLIA